MDDQSTDQSDESSNDSIKIYKVIFGNANDENKIENRTTRSDCEDELEMNTNDDTIINNDSSCEKTTEDASCSQLPLHNHTEIVENPCFGSHILDPKSKESNSSDQPSSFAKITKDYEKSMEGMSKNVVGISENDSPVSQLQSKSTVIFSKTNLEPLSWISNNYQSSSSDSDVLIDANDIKCADSDDNLSVISVSSNPFTKESVKTRGELDITDLPPIEDLKISVDEEKCQPIGCVKSFVDTLVIVEAFFNLPALDIDSVLFLDRGKRALGRIFDVFGPVNKPYYAVRFNDSDHIKKFNVLVKEPVFCAPETEYSSYVLVSQLLKMKGSDASWRHNNEPPPECLDYSDDEAEKLAKKKRKQKKNHKGNNTDDKKDSPEPPASQNSVNRSRSVSVVSKQQQSFPFSFNQKTPRTAYSPGPPNFRPCSSNYESPRPPNFSARPSNNYDYTRPLNISACPPNFDSPPPNFNLRPPNFNPGPQSYGYDQRPPFLSYAQQLSAMEYNPSYRQPFYPPQHYNQNNMYPPRPVFPNHNQQMPPGFNNYQQFSQTNPNNPVQQMHFPQ